MIAVAEVAFGVIIFAVAYYLGRQSMRALLDTVVENYERALKARDEELTEQKLDNERLRDELKLLNPRR